MSIIKDCELLDCQRIGMKYLLPMTRTVNIMLGNFAEIYCLYVIPGGLLRRNLELHIKSNDAVLKSLTPATDGIELIAFSQKGYINATTSYNSISGSISPIISYLYLSLLLLLFSFLHH